MIGVSLMGLMERLYRAARRSKFLVTVQFNGQSVAVGFTAPDESVLDGLVRSTAYTIRYPTSELPALAPGHTLTIEGIAYTVRDVRAVGDGTERIASLSRV
jgi:hypothetical protein